MALLRNKKLIETALPLSLINKSTIGERVGTLGSAEKLHIWWGRSPKYSSLSSLAAALMNAPENKDELLERLNHISNFEDTQLKIKPTVLDPFSGFGGIPLAAQTLELPVVAGDLNPVAVMITKAATEIPSRFANRNPINQLSLVDKHLGASGLAEDVQYYGEWMFEKASEKLKDLYPNELEGKIAGWLWARTVKCSNPACGCRMPLATSFILNGKESQKSWAEPIIQNGIASFIVHDGECPENKITNKYSNRGARFICPSCGEITPDTYIKEKGLNHELGTQMMAIIIDTPNGNRVFKSPTVNQEQAANVPVPENAPKGSIPDNPYWFGPPGFGFKEYANLFSPRQLTMLTTFCDLLCEVQDKAYSDAVTAGMSSDNHALADGGNGALAYSQAIVTYLSFVIDKMADHNSTICSWNSSAASPRATFGRQAIPMVWNFVEVNPFGTMTGNFHYALKNVVSAISNLPCTSEVKAYQGDAVTTLFPENTLICTELPYYKAIGYAHLSDFFYIWMRRSLKPIFPDLFNQMVTPKDELSTVGQFYGENKKDCEQKYEEKLHTVIEKLYKAASLDYPALIFFEYHRNDERTIHSENREWSAWDKFLQTFIDAGFAINAIWPTRSEEVSDCADGIRILVVVRKQEKTEQTTKRALINTLKRELPDLLDKAFCGGVDDCDKELVAMGCGLSVITRFKQVLNADGTVLCVHDALQLIYQELKNYPCINSGIKSDDCAETKEE